MRYLVPPPVPEEGEDVVAEVHAGMRGGVLIAEADEALAFAAIDASFKNLKPDVAKLARFEDRFEREPIVIAAQFRPNDFRSRKMIVEQIAADDDPAFDRRDEKRPIELRAHDPEQRFLGGRNVIDASGLGEMDAEAQGAKYCQEQPRFHPTVIYRLADQASTVPIHRCKTDGWRLNNRPQFLGAFGKGG